jgi:hypothetical protein
MPSARYRGRARDGSSALVAKADSNSRSRETLVLARAPLVSRSDDV